jgi:hypothetical protein
MHQNPIPAAASKTAAALAQWLSVGQQNGDSETFVSIDGHQSDEFTQLAWLGYRATKRPRAGREY